MKEAKAGYESNRNKITFWLNGQMRCEEVPAGISTLDWLHQHFQMYGTKCSCNEGDCGACTVVIAGPEEGLIEYKAINSCLYPAAKLHGRHLITIEGLGTPDALHPIQAALLEHHGTQCGYCTPGFVMSMFALFAMHRNPGREEIMAALEGNLCRCTGYISILDAAEELSQVLSPQSCVPQWCRSVEPELYNFKIPAELILHHATLPRSVHRYLLPEDMKSLLDYIAVEHEAVFIAGGTDIMVQRNISKKKFPVLIDLCRVPELQKLYLQKDGLHIGAAVTYGTLLASGIVKTDYPALHGLIRLIAAAQIRNFGTLAGNIANASPVGDTLPLLMVMDASLRLQSELELRHLPLCEFFLGYRKTALNPHEFIKEVIIPPPDRNAYIRTIKSAKRKSVDISAVITAINVKQEEGIIRSASLALGGVAVTTMRSSGFSHSVIGKKPAELDAEAISETVAKEFTPLSDVRGSAAYRRQLIRNHLQIYIDELKGRNHA